MNIFDKICACLALPLGAVFILLGVPGLFTGCKANFALPPILGVVPALIGWGIIKSIIVAWRKPKQPEVVVPTVEEFRSPIEEL